jgi:hypothetical protein
MNIYTICLCFTVDLIKLCLLLNYVYFLLFCFTIFTSITKPIAQSIGAMIKVSFPEWYEKYRKVFEAGVWLREDPGPFLRRAIIYKLQRRLHKNANDLGPFASFGVGDYTCGKVLFPQLGAKFW